MEKLKETLLRVILPIMAYVSGLRWALQVVDKAGYEVISTALVFISLCIGSWLFVDRIIFWKVDTYNEIVDRQNVAYALLLVAVAILALAGTIIGG